MYLGKEALADGSRFGINILLAHEAYRNGVDDGEAGQKQETQEAVVGHIHAALALSQIYGMGSIGEAMSYEVNAYLDAIKNGNEEALANIMGGYDASGDYWRLTKDGKLLFDKRATLTIENDDGSIKEVGWKELGVSSDKAVESALVKILHVDAKTVRMIMEQQMGLKHSSEKDSEKWNWMNERVPEKGWFPFVKSIGDQNNGKGISIRDLDKNIQAKMRKDVFISVYKNELQGGVIEPERIQNLISKQAKWSNKGSNNYDPFSVRVLEEFGNVFNNLDIKTQRELVNKRNISTMGSLLLNNIMSPKEWEKYKAEGNQTFCSTFGYEKLVNLDPRIAVSAFPHGFVRANEWQTTLEKSPLFKKISNDNAIDTMKNAANLAGMGQLVIAILNANPDPGHVAFVVPNNTPYKSLNNAVKITGNGLEGYNNTPGNTPGYTIPVFTGVGTSKSTGILPFGYTFGIREREDPLKYTRIEYYRLGW
jgi:hypothetical protein